MSVPITYAEWVLILDVFGNGDDTVLEQMEAGQFTLDGGTAQRFYARVEETYRKRKESWLTKFQRSFQVHAIRTDDELEAVLRDGKQNLLPLVKFVGIKAFPDDLLKILSEDLSNFVAESKKSLKDRAIKSVNGQEKLLLILDRFMLPEIQAGFSANKTTTEPMGNPIIPGKGRKIIF